jgi:hypothetical protein
MAYPQAPNFTIAAPDMFNPPAWWSYMSNGQSVCATTGGTFIRAARQAVGVSSNPTWDADLQNALIARAQSYAAAQPSANWQPVIQQLQQTLAARQVDPLSVRFAIWLAYYAPHNLRFDAVDLPPGAILPRWGVRAPESLNGTFVCFNPQRDPNPNVLSQSEFASAVDQSVMGVRLHPGETLPTLAEVPQGPAGVSTPALLGIGAAAAIVIGAMAMSGRKKNPSDGCSPCDRATRAMLLRHVRDKKHHVYP